MARTDGDDAIRDIADRLYGENVRIVAASWGPVHNPNWKADGLWMSFYSPSSLNNDGILDEATARRARAMLPPLTVDNEAAIAWRPDGAPVDTYLLHGGEGQDGTINWTPDGTLVVQSHGSLDAGDAVDLRLTLVHAIRTVRPLRLVLDLRDVTALDPINAETLAAACRLGDDHQVAVFVHAATPALARQLTAAGLPHDRLREPAT